MEIQGLLKIALSLAFVLGLIGLVAVLARTWKLPEKLAGVGQKSRRMEIKEVLYVDAKHKLILVKKDSAEHLILIGQGDSTLIESTSNSPKGVEHVKNPA